MEHRAALQNLSDRDDVEVIGEAEEIGGEQFRGAREGLDLVGPQDNPGAPALLEQWNEELARRGDEPGLALHQLDHEGCDSIAVACE